MLHTRVPSTCSSWVVHTATVYCVLDAGCWVLYTEHSFCDAQGNLKTEPYSPASYVEIGHCIGMALHEYFIVPSRAAATVASAPAGAPYAAVGGSLGTGQRTTGGRVSSASTARGVAAAAAAADKAPCVGGGHLSYPTGVAGSSSPSLARAAPTVGAAVKGGGA